MTKIKLITPWYGTKPSWYNKFMERVKANKIISHELIVLNGPQHLSLLASEVSGVECVKGSMRAQCCDLRPLFGEMFASHLAGFSWWGWCDLDIIMGDLDTMLLPLLDQYDAISWQDEPPYAFNGGLTLFRNIAEVNSIYRAGPYKEVLNTTEYLNWDEGGCEGGFISVVRTQGLRVHIGMQARHEGCDMLEGVYPSRTCDLLGNALIEYPTGRELALYHLGSKIWPLGGDGKWVRPMASYSGPHPWLTQYRDSERLTSTPTTQSTVTGIGLKRSKDAKALEARMRMMLRANKRRGEG